MLVLSACFAVKATRRKLATILKTLYTEQSDSRACQAIRTIASYVSGSANYPIVTYEPAAGANIQTVAKWVRDKAPKRSKETVRDSELVFLSILIVLSASSNEVSTSSQLYS